MVHWFMFYLYLLLAHPFATSWVPHPAYPAPSRLALRRWSWESQVGKRTGSTTKTPILRTSTPNPRPPAGWGGAVQKTCGNMFYVWNVKGMLYLILHAICLYDTGKHICIYIYVCVCVYLFNCLYTYTYTYVFFHLLIYCLVLMCAYIMIYIYIYIQVCVYIIYVCTCTGNMDMSQH